MLEMACEKEMACCVRDYHVYKDTWAAAIGEVLVCSREPTNIRKKFVCFLWMKIFLQRKKANYGTYMYACMGLLFVDLAKFSCNLILLRS